MTKNINKNDFLLREISREFHNNFIAMDSNELSDAESWMLKTVGDALRESGSEHFWNNGHYSWFINYPNEGRSIEQRIFLTNNGIIVFEDCEKGKMYRVCPK